MIEKSGRFNNVYIEDFINDFNRYLTNNHCSLNYLKHIIDVKFHEYTIKHDVKDKMALNVYWQGQKAKDIGFTLGYIERNEHNHSFELMLDYALNKETFQIEREGNSDIYIQKMNNRSIIFHKKENKLKLLNFFVDNEKINVCSFPNNEMRIASEYLYNSYISKYANYSNTLKNSMQDDGIDEKYYEEYKSLKEVSFSLFEIYNAIKQDENFTKKFITMIETGVDFTPEEKEMFPLLFDINITNAPYQEYIILDKSSQKSYNIALK